MKEAIFNAFDLILDLFVHKIAHLNLEFCNFLCIQKLPRESVFDCVGQPLNLNPPCSSCKRANPRSFASIRSTPLIQVELLRRRLRLVQIQGTSLPNFRFSRQFLYRQYLILLQICQTTALRKSESDRS
jgi:hypothetical protein